MGGAFSGPGAPLAPPPPWRARALCCAQTCCGFSSSLSRWPPAVGTSRFVPTIKLQRPQQNTSLFHDFTPHALLALHRASFPACTAGGDPSHPRKAHPLQTLPFPDAPLLPLDQGWLSHHDFRTSQGSVCSSIFLACRTVTSQHLGNMHFSPPDPQTVNTVRGRRCGTDAAVFRGQVTPLSFSPPHRTRGR